MEAVRMEQISVGKARLMTSRIGLGTWPMGGTKWGGTDEAQDIATIRSAVDRGVTLIDTAPVYGFGRSEETVGKAIAEGGLRDQVQIATKFGLNWTTESDDAVFRDSRPDQIRKEVEASLKRLRTDVIDIYLVHWPDLETPIDVAADALEALRKQGKIRAVGVSNFSPSQMDEFRAHTELDVAQPPYNLFERGIEADVLPYARKNGLALMCYGALCRGLLTGTLKHDTAFKGDDLRNTDPKFKADRFGSYLAAVEDLATLARERYDKSLVALAIRWILDQGPTIALWGARHPRELDPVDEIEGWRLDDAALKDIDAILQRHVPQPIHPTFMAPPEKRPPGTGAPVRRPSTHGDERGARP
jgi:aryl-alcohol dehydrogenase-like predicted oxidoreductase